MKRSMVTLPVLFILAILAYAWFAPASPSESNATPVILATPTVSYPACVDEAGDGQALCYWDAAKQGNGKGQSSISGDCAPDVMGAEASALCVNLYSQPGQDHTMSDGSINTIPNGADLVRECLDENERMTDKEKAENGFDLYHCFEAWML